MKELLEHYQKFLTIVQKMNKSQLDDLGIIKEELTRALNEGELLKTQLENIELLAKKQVSLQTFYTDFFTTGSFKTILLFHSHICPY